MMNKFCQLQRLKAQRGLDCSLEEKDKVKPGVKFEMDPKAYDYILKFCQESIPDLQAESNLHNSSNSKVLARYARALQMAECGVGRYITPHPPNNIVEHVSGTQTCYSQVCEIVELVGHGVN